MNQFIKFWFEQSILSQEAKQKLSRIVSALRANSEIDWKKIQKTIESNPSFFNHDGTLLVTFSPVNGLILSGSTKDPVSFEFPQENLHHIGRCRVYLDQLSKPFAISAPFKTTIYCLHGDAILKFYTKTLDSFIAIKLTAPQKYVIDKDLIFSFKVCEHGLYLLHMTDPQYAVPGVMIDFSKP